MTASYYADDKVTLYLGNCLEVTEWLAADVLVTDPPYGRAWQQGGGMLNASGGGRGSKSHGGIAGDKDTATRDAAVAMWGLRPAALFGDPLVPPPLGAVQALVYRKQVDAGVKGARAGFRRDVEMIYLAGPWTAGVGGRSSILTSSALVAGPTGAAARYGHSHAKPTDLMEQILEVCPPGVIADPFAGSGSTLVAARNLGRKAIGVELEERYCEVIARRLAQDCLDFGESA
jgi:hypothetical protein